MTGKRRSYQTIGLRLLLLAAPILTKAQGSGFGLGVIVVEPTGLSAKA